MQEGSGSNPSAQLNSQNNTRGSLLYENIKLFMNITGSNQSTAAAYVSRQNTLVDALNEYFKGPPEDVRNKALMIYLNRLKMQITVKKTKLLKSQKTMIIQLAQEAERKKS